MLTDTIRSLASVQKISKLTPIENSDFLEVAEMENLGWKVVVKRGDFHVGQIIVYFEIDSAINVNDLLPSMEFLKDKCLKKLFTGKTPETSAFSGEYVRIKTLKLRGQVSQGLIVPISDIQKNFPGYTFPNIPDIEDSVGADLTKELKIEVWDRLLEWYAERSQLGTKAQMHSAGTFPSFAPKTDEERLENNIKYFKDPEMVEATWECTVKEDGSSCTLFYCPEHWPEDPMRISSRRFLLKDDGGSDDWFAAFKKIGWEKLQKGLEGIYKNGYNSLDWDDSGPRGHWVGGHEYAIQGEMTGPKFQGNRDKRSETHFSVFRIFDITDQKFLEPNQRYALCHLLGLEHVPVIETCQIFKKLKSIEDFEKYVDRKSKNGNQIEGIVFKRIDNGDISFKKVSAKYLLHEK